MLCAKLMLKKVGHLGLSRKCRRLVGTLSEFFDSHIHFLFEGKLLEEWMLSSLVPYFKGKGDPLIQNSYRELKLLEHTFKFHEKVLNG